MLVSDHSNIVELDLAVIVKHANVICETALKLVFDLHLRHLMLVISSNAFCTEIVT